MQWGLNVFARVAKISTDLYLATYIVLSSRRVRLHTGCTRTCQRPMYNQSSMN